MDNRILSCLAYINKVLVITSLGGQIGIHCLSRFFKILKLFESSEENFEVFKNYEIDLSPKSPEPSMWLLVNHTKPPKTFY